MSLNKSDVLRPAEKAQQTHLLLQELYGELPLEPRREPMHELLSTMLSHRTTHANEEAAYYNMINTFGDWQGVLAAPFEALADTLKPAKFPGAKAQNIQKALTRIRERSPDFSLDFLRDLPEAERTRLEARIGNIAATYDQLSATYQSGKADNDIPLS